MSGDLAEFVARVDEAVAKLWREQHRLAPMWHFEDRAGKATLAVTPWDNQAEKDYVAAKVRGLLRSSSIVRYAMITEVWMVVAPRGQKRLTDHARRLAGEGRLSTHPDRREAVLIAAEERGGRSIQRTRFILRPEHGGPTLSPPRDIESNYAAGRFISMFRDAGND